MVATLATPFPSVRKVAPLAPCPANGSELLFVWLLNHSNSDFLKLELCMETTHCGRLKCVLIKLIDIVYVGGEVALGLAL
jgi:hypothetical protein